MPPLMCWQTITDAGTGETTLHVGVGIRVTGPHCKECVTHLTVHDQLHEKKLGHLFTSVCDLEVSPTLVVPSSIVGTAIWM